VGEIKLKKAVNVTKKAQGRLAFLASVKESICRGDYCNLSLCADDSFRLGSIHAHLVVHHFLLKVFLSHHPLPYESGKPEGVGTHLARPNI
jgi:hypothetical protein